MGEESGLAVEGGSSCLEIAIFFSVGGNSLRVKDLVLVSRTWEELSKYRILADMNERLSSLMISKSFISAVEGTVKSDCTCRGSVCRLL